ncbi:MAG: TldD/PmbA family protein [Candidatus Hodarchaeota archaeon]
MNIEELKGIATMALEMGEKQNPDEIEVYLGHQTQTNVNIQNGRISGSEHSVDVGLGIRIAFPGKKVGTAFTTNLAKDAIKKTILNVSRTAKKSAVDEEWLGLPTKSGTPPKEKYYFSHLHDIPIEEIAKVAADLIKGCTVEGIKDPIIPILGNSLLAFSNVVTMNSHGIEAVDQASFFVVLIAALAIKEGKPGPYNFDYFVSRDKVLDDPIGFANEIAKEAYNLANAKKVKLPEKVPVVFHPYGLSSLAQFIFLPSIRADVKQQGNSILADRLGEQIVPGDFDMYDDGTLPGCISSSLYDAEGIAKHRTPIFEKGIFRSFIYDHTTAQKDALESTGNAQRSDETGVNPGEYANVPKVSTSNWVVKPGTVDLENLISDIKLGVLVKNVQGAHQGSPESGEYTGVINPGWVIRNGEISEPVVGLGLGGQILELFNNFEGATSSTKTLISAHLPHVRFSQMRIVS